MAHFITDVPSHHHRSMRFVLRILEIYPTFRRSGALSNRREGVVRAMAKLTQIGSVA